MSSDTPKLEFSRPSDGKTPWGQVRRLAFIDFRLQYEGEVYRKDLKDFFGISVQQASLDLAAYSALAPNQIRYDATIRRFVPDIGFKPLYGGDDAASFLNDLLALSNEVISRDESFIGWAPDYGIVPTLKRPLPASQLATVLLAIRKQRSLQIRYQSMSREEPSLRDISPHALGHDGFRWHVRAFCHKRQDFADFVFGRMLDTQPSVADWVDGADDRQWHRTVWLDLKPHSELSAAQRAAIALDYGMVNGHTRVKTRQALLFYALKRFGLNKRGEAEARTQHIELANRAEVSQYLDEEAPQ